MLRKLNLESLEDRWLPTAGPMVWVGDQDDQWFNKSNWREYNPATDSIIGPATAVPSGDNVVYFNSRGLSSCEIPFDRTASPAAIISTADYLRTLNIAGQLWLQGGDSVLGDLTTLRAGGSLHVDGGHLTVMATLVKGVNDIDVGAFFIGNGATVTLTTAGLPGLITQAHVVVGRLGWGEADSAGTLDVYLGSGNINLSTRGDLVVRPTGTMTLAAGSANRSFNGDGMVNYGTVEVAADSPLIVFNLAVSNRQLLRIKDDASVQFTVNNALYGDQLVNDGGILSLGDHVTLTGNVLCKSGAWLELAGDDPTDGASVTINGNMRLYNSRVWVHGVAWADEAVAFRWRFYGCTINTVAYAGYLYEVDDEANLVANRVAFRFEATEDEIWLENSAVDILFMGEPVGFDVTGVQSWKIFHVADSATEGVEINGSLTCTVHGTFVPDGGRWGMLWFDRVGQTSVWKTLAFALAYNLDEGGDDDVSFVLPGSPPIGPPIEPPVLGGSGGGTII